MMNSGRRGRTWPAFQSQFNDWEKVLLARVQNDPEALKIPVLIMWGHDDHSVPLTRGYAHYDVIAAQNPRVRMIVINKADHFDFCQYVDEYNMHITNFIEYWEHQPGEKGTASAQAK